MGTSPRLLLVGAGHAHLEVLRRLGARDHPPVELTVVSDTSHQLYSGMVPGFLYGEYREEEVAVALTPLVTRAKGKLVESRATGVDPGARRVRLEGGGEVGYDLVSFNVGSRTAGEGTPGVREHAAVIKPIERALEVRRRLRELAGSERGREVAVVGAGAAGVEVACAARTVLDRAGGGGVRLLEAGGEILPGYSERVRSKARRVLAARGVKVRIGAPVAAVRAGGVELEGGEDLPADLVVWLTGAAAPPLFAGSALTLDDRGFLLVDPALRSLSHPEVFGAGDCVTPAAHPETPKAGVYAVRAAPVLWRSLLAALGARGRYPSYEPQRSFLSILNTADGRALLRWKGIVSHSRWAWRLKDRIDRRFIAKYQDPP
ncbi:MAG TPA: FAD-dependent oxidoreductase [Thermoanaerobaculia bacterium]|nr:FAD-dependent oxidoreductase [Thermoanaerobaculia bacterium]